MPDDDSLEPSPAQLGDTLTLPAGEWTPLDDYGTEIYIYGDQPVDVAIQTDLADRVRQLQAEVDQLRGDLNALGGLRIVEHPDGDLRIITAALHDRLCPIRVASPQEAEPGILRCHFCGFCYPRPARIPEATA